jgi:hypothetical protein
MSANDWRPLSSLGPKDIAIPAVLGLKQNHDLASGVKADRWPASLPASSGTSGGYMPEESFKRP